MQTLHCRLCDLIHPSWVVQDMALCAQTGAGAAHALVALEQSSAACRLLA